VVDREHALTQHAPIRDVAASEQFDQRSPWRSIRPVSG
jgi:hypothetical protein